LHQRRTVGPGRRRAVGNGLPARRPADSAPSEPALRGGPRRGGAADRAGSPGAGRRTAASRPDPRRLRRLLCGGAVVLRAVPRTGRTAGLPVGRRDDGPAPVDPAVHRRNHAHRPRPAAAAGVSLMTDERTPLDALIRARIARDGPMPVAEYM